jgi:hypothetical protein
VIVGPTHLNYYYLQDHYSNVRAYFEGALNAVYSLYMTSECCASTSIGELMDWPDDDTGEWPILPIGLACFQSGARGPRRATMVDMWFGSDAVADGTTYPMNPNPTYEFAQVDNLIWPWNGTPLETF